LNNYILFITIKKYYKNINIYIGKEKVKKKEIETQIDKELNSNLIKNDNYKFTYESIKPKKVDK